MRTLQSLVVVDTDARRREALAFGFRRAGLSVHATAEPRQSIVPGRAAGAVVVVTPLAGTTLPELLATLRRPPHPPMVLVIGGPGEREMAEQAGADEFLPRPAFFRDVLTVARLAVAVRCGARRFEGAIEEYGLFYVARALHHARRSATVEVQRAGGSARQGRTGELRFSRGHLTAARAGRQHGANAFLQLLVWERGPLAVTFGEPPRDERAIVKPTERLFDDGQSFLAEFRVAVGRLGGPDVVYARDDARVRALGGLIPREVRQWVDSIDGTRTVLDHVEDAPFKPFETLAIVHRLVALGAVARSADPPAPAPEERARRAAREWLLGFAQPGAAPAPLASKPPAPPPPPTAPVPAASPVTEERPSGVPEPIAADAPAVRPRKGPPRPPPVPSDVLRRMFEADEAATRPFVRPTEEELGLPDVTPLPAPRPPGPMVVFESAGDDLFTRPSVLAPTGETAAETSPASAPPPLPVAPEPVIIVDSGPALGPTPVPDSVPEPVRIEKTAPLAGAPPPVDLPPVMKASAGAAPRAEAPAPPPAEAPPLARAPKRDDGNPFVAPQSITGRFLRETGRFLRDSGRFPRFDTVDEDFFSREEEATRVEPAERFDDLEPIPEEIHDEPSGGTRTWFGLRPPHGKRSKKKR